jgi:hypothetical protein
VKDWFHGYVWIYWLFAQHGRHTASGDIAVQADFMNFQVVAAASQILGHTDFYKFRGADLTKFLKISWQGGKKRSTAKKQMATNRD